MLMENVSLYLGKGKDRQYQKGTIAEIEDEDYNSFYIKFEDGRYLWESKWKLSEIDDGELVSAIRFVFYFSCSFCFLIGCLSVFLIEKL